MRKRLMMLIIVIVLLSLTLSIYPSNAASGDGWEAWFYEPNTDELLRVSVSNDTPDDYTVTPYFLSAARDFFVDPPVLPSYANTLAVSGEMERVAYCSREDSTTVSATTLIIFDPFTETYEAYDLGDTAGCTFSTAGIDDASNTIAFGIFAQMPITNFDMFPIDESTIFWEIVVLDLNSGDFIGAWRMLIWVKALHLTHPFLIFTHRVAH